MINREGGKTVIKLPKAAGVDTTAASSSDDAPAMAQTDAETDRHPVASQPGDAAISEAAISDGDSRDGAYEEATREASAHGPFVPLLLLAAASLAWMGFQSWLLLTDLQALQAAHASQQQTVDNAAKLRASLDTLAADTQRLAEAGNGNARLLVEELKKRGVTINPAAAQAGK